MPKHLPACIYKEQDHHLIQRTSVCDTTNMEPKLTVALFLCCLAAVQASQSDEYIVVIKRHATTSQIRDLLQTLDVIHQIQLGRRLVVLIRADPALVRRLKHNRLVDYVEFNHRMGIAKRSLDDVADDVIAGEFMVQFRANLPHGVRDELLSGLKSRSQIEMGANYVTLVESSTDVMERLSTNPLIRVIEPNRKIELVHPVEVGAADSSAETISSRLKSRVRTVSNAQCTEQAANDSIWHLSRTSYVERPDYDVDPYLYEHDGEGVNLYIIDSGVHIDHPDFGGRAHWGMTSEGLYDREGHDDLNGHGTHVASTAGGSHWGIAKKATIYSAKSLGRLGAGSTFNIIESVDWSVDHHIAEKNAGKKPRGIINMSLGGAGFSQIFMDAIDRAYDEGVPVIAAAGNSNADTISFFPAAFNSSIAIGATDRNDTIATFSNWGCSVAVSAPGVSVMAAWTPNGLFCSDFEEVGDCIRSISGTSMSSPVVMGIAARYMSAMTDEEYESFTPDMLRDMLTATAVQGKITFNNINQTLTTTNRLVYKECGQTDWDPQHVYTPCPFFAPEEDDPIGTYAPGDPTEPEEPEPTEPSTGVASVTTTSPLMMIVAILAILPSM